MQDRIKLPLHPDACSVDGWSTDEQRVLREFAQAVARERKKIADDSDYGPIQHHIGDQISARFGLGE